MSLAPSGRPALSARARARVLRQRRRRLVVLIVALAVVGAVLVAALGRGWLPSPPAAGVAASAGGRDPFGYASAREADYIARATAGNAHVLFDKSPGGVVATAARVAAYRPLIDRAVAGTGIDPALLEGIVFVESAGRPQVMAGSDPASAAGLTQILAQTGQSLLGMHIDLARSRRLTAAIDAVAAGTRRGLLAPLLVTSGGDRSALQSCRRAWPAPCAISASPSVSSGAWTSPSSPTTWASATCTRCSATTTAAAPFPTRSSTSTRRPTITVPPTGFYPGSATTHGCIYWRVLGAVSIMRLYRGDRSALTRLASLQNADGAGAAVLHPPDRTLNFADPAALSAAYQDRSLVPLPTNLAALGLSVARTMGSGASRLGVPPGLYRGLRPGALKLLIALAARVRSLSGGAQPLELFTTVADRQYNQSTGAGFAAATNGWSFQIARRYVSHAQAQAFQTVLDRLQALEPDRLDEGRDTDRRHRRHRRRRVAGVAPAHAARQADRLAA